MRLLHEKRGGNAYLGRSRQVFDADIFLVLLLKFCVQASHQDCLVSCYFLLQISQSGPCDLL